MASQIVSSFTAVACVSFGLRYHSFCLGALMAIAVAAAHHFPLELG